MQKQWSKWFSEAGGAHLTKPGWSKPHTHSNPTNLALFRRKITLNLYIQLGGGSYYCRESQMGAGGWAPGPLPHFNHRAVFSSSLTMINTVDCYHQLGLDEWSAGEPLQQYRAARQTPTAVCLTSLPSATTAQSPARPPRHRSHPAAASADNQLTSSQRHSLQLLHAPAVCNS